MASIKLWLAKKLACKHLILEYELAGAKACPRSIDYCECGCSIPVYTVSCISCGKAILLGEDELIDFLAMEKEASSGT